MVLLTTNDAPFDERHHNTHRQQYTPGQIRPQFGDFRAEIGDISFGGNMFLTALQPGNLLLVLSYSGAQADIARVCLCGHLNSPRIARDSLIVGASYLD